MMKPFLRSEASSELYGSRGLLGQIGLQPLAGRFQKPVGLARIVVAGRQAGRCARYKERSA